MKISHADRFLGFVTIVGTVALLTLITVFLVGCEHGSRIPFDVISGSGGTPVDVCATEGVEDCCPDCDTCVDRYDVGFDDGVASVVCTTPDPSCDDDVDDDCAHDAHKNAHKHCRGRGHNK